MRCLVLCLAVECWYTSTEIVHSCTQVGALQEETDWFRHGTQMLNSEYSE